MGGWHFWGALIIGAVIWIVGQLLRNSAQQEEKRTPAAPGPEDRAAGQRRPAPGSTELDRFLQEVNRRKQNAEQRTRAQTENRPAVAPSPRSSVDAPLAARPAGASSPPPVRRRPSRPAAEGPSTRAPQRRAPAGDVPVLLEVVPVVEPSPPAPAPLPTVLPAPSPAKAPAFPPTQGKIASPALRQLLAMLGSKNNLRAAILLREVLDPPMCHRRR